MCDFPSSDVTRHLLTPPERSLGARLQRDKLEALRAALSRLPVNPEGGQFTRGEHGTSVSLWKGLEERLTSISAGRSPSLLEGGAELERSPNPFQCGEANVVE